MADIGFGGRIPSAYDQYLVPLFMLDNGAHLVEGVTAPQNGAVLETAAGTGIVSRLLRDALPDDVSLIATDLSPDMVAFAAEHAALPGVEFRQADATALPFADASFDAVVTQFGVMFFPDKAAGYNEAARVLRPGGRFVFNVWDSFEQNPLASITYDVIRRLFPVNPPNFVTIPFGYYDVEEITRALHSSGFTSVTADVRPGRASAANARDAALAIVTGNPFVIQIEERGDPTVEAVLSELTEAFGDAYGAAPLDAPMQSIRFVAMRD